MPLDRQKIKKLIEEKKKEPIILDLPKNVLKGLELKVYEVIRDGRFTGKHLYVGATDPELQKIFSEDSASSVRYARWRLEKEGYVKKHGKRAPKKGSRLSHVYVLEDIYQQIEKIEREAQDGKAFGEGGGIHGEGRPERIGET